MSMFICRISEVLQDFLCDFFRTESHNFTEFVKDTLSCGIELEWPVRPQSLNLWVIDLFLQHSFRVIYARFWVNHGLSGCFGAYPRMIAIFWVVDYRWKDWIPVFIADHITFDPFDVTIQACLNSSYAREGSAKVNTRGRLVV